MAYCLDRGVTVNDRLLQSDDSISDAPLDRRFAELLCDIANDALRFLVLTNREEAFSDHEATQSGLFIHFKSKKCGTRRVKMFEAAFVLTFAN